MYHFVWSYSDQGTEGPVERQYTTNVGSLEVALEEFREFMNCKDYQSFNWVLIGTTINGQGAERYIKKARKEKKGTMITKEQFEQGKHALAEQEFRTILTRIEKNLEAGITTTTTYETLRTKTDTLVKLLQDHVKQFGWTLSHSVYNGDQRDSGTTHTWKLT